MGGSGGRGRGNFLVDQVGWGDRSVTNNDMQSSSLIERISKKQQQKNNYFSIYCP